MYKILKFIYTHPLNKNNKIKSLLRFIKWQISSRLWKGAFIYDWINDSKLIIENGMTGATGNIYVGLMEYEDMSFLLHYLSKSDTFFDIGANVGVYSILASKVKNVKTISIEPLPDTYEKLKDNIKINRLSNIKYENIGLSDKKSKLYFTIDKDTMNSVAINSDENTKEVYVDTLDNLAERYIVPSVIKIDVEGYETNVLSGAHNVLKNKNCKILIIELNNSGLKYGYNDSDIHTNLLSYGFQSYTYNPFSRQLVKLDSYGYHNTIYIKSDYLNVVQKKVSESDFFSINGMKI
ncbi:MAG: FkbM family methyltransferase [Helicobacteraceae bacterium]|nr:FkbM family methyltransferase [Helicobacteraceae bacterium]